MASNHPGDAALIAKAAAHVKWAMCPDRAAATAAAREAFRNQFERQVDPNNELPEAERLRRAESARKAHFSRMALKSAQARRARAGERKAGGAA